MQPGVDVGGGGTTRYPPPENRLAAKLVDGRYRLLQVLGSGGMATVWRAFDVRLQREVALKRPHPMADGDPRRERLVREARIAASVSSPHLVTVHDVGSDREGLYLVMELVEAPSLADVGRRLSPREVLTVGADVAQGLAAVHAKGIVHRDVKPANILMPERGAKLTDFGIALNAGYGTDPASRLTEPGMVLATANYAAPEVLAGHPPSPASDVYSLGVVLRELLGRTGDADLDDLLDRATAAESWLRPGIEALASGLRAAGPRHLDRPGTGNGIPVVADGAVTRTLAPDAGRWSPPVSTGGSDPTSGSAPTMAMPSADQGSAGGIVAPMSTPPPPAPGAGPNPDTGFNRRPPFGPTAADGVDSGAEDSERRRSPSSLPLVALIGAVAVVALVGLLVVQLFSNGLARLGDTWDSVSDLADGTDVTVPSTGETASEESTSQTSTTEAAPAETRSDDDDDDDDDDDGDDDDDDDGNEGGRLGSLFGGVEDSIQDLEQDLSDAVDAGNEARDTARDLQDVVSKIEEAVEKAQADKPDEAADRLNEAADRIDERLSGRQRDRARALLDRWAVDLGFEVNDENRFEADRD